MQSLLVLKDTAELHSILAEVCEKQSKFLPAAKEYQRVAQMEPTETSSEVSHSENIEQLLKRAIALDPNLAQTHMQLGIRYARREDNPRAAG